MAQAQYTFLPWLRRGIVGLDNVADTGRLSVALQLNVTGQRTETVAQTVHLYGPGDITGLDRRAVVRTVPRAGVRDFEANFLPAIEFYDEDFPWRYTPQGQPGGRLSPWLWLVALADGEFARKGVTGTLPAIEISPEGQRGAFPPLETAWAWAHVHLNFGVSNDLADACKHLEKQLNENPNLGCSRLLCPRRLRPDTRYTAFLVPAFEKGRLAGLGYAGAEVEATPNLASSWLPEDQVNGPRLFPVYFEWEFSTSSAGDFEHLASLLQPLESGVLSQSALHLDIQDPGWGLRYEGDPGTAPMESALQPVQAASQPVTGSSNAADQAFVRALCDLLNLGAGNTGEQDDPFVVPPVYGSFYRPGIRLDATNPENWLDQLNLNPVYRVAAGQGTAAVQQHQEEFMDRAWDQLGNYTDARRIDQRWELSLQTSRSFFSKHFLPVLHQNIPDKTLFGAIALTAPLHAVLRVETGGRSMARPSVAETLKGPYAGVYSTAFSRITRSNGPLMRRFNSKTTTFGDIFFNLTFTGTTIPNYLEETVRNVIREMSVSSGGGLGGSSGSPSPFTERRLENAGLVSVAACKQALENLLPYLAVPATEANAGSAGKVKSAHRGMRDQLDPQAAISARRRGVVVLQDARGKPVEAFTSFSVPDPMYRILAERSTDFILPGLDRIKPNRVVLLQTNQAFVEAYMVGLNHELAREFLWREYPAALNDTFFRQFWDVRDNPKYAEFEDIKPASEWKTNALGKNRPATAGSDPVVIAIRGDLLRKYPDTEMYLHRAEWIFGQDNQRTGRRPMTRTGAEIQIPAFFSARLEPDYLFLGFGLDAGAVIGEGDDPGWFFVMKERAGSVQFGLEVGNEAPGDLSWSALNDVQEHRCIDVESETFKGLLGNRPARADGIATALYQKPFIRYVHAARLI